MKYLSPNAISAPQWLQHWSDCAPEKPAFIYLQDSGAERREITFAQLRDRVSQIAAKLVQYGQAGDRVLLTYQPGLDFIEAFLGCLWAGRIAVPVYPPTGLNDWPRFARIAVNSDASIIATSSALLELASNGLSQTPELRSITLLATNEGGDDQQIIAGLPCPTSIAAGDLAFLQYTSGSTGSPKGVMLSHSNLAHNERLIQEAFHLNHDSVVVCWLPQYHDMGLIGNILGALYNGMTAVAMSPLTFLKRPWLWLKAISDFRATVSGGPNFSFELCIDRVTDEQRDQLDLSCWQLAYSGAEPVNATTLHRFADRFAECGFQRNAFMPVYGLAESSLLVTRHPWQQKVETQRVDADQLAANRIVPAQDGQPFKDLVSCGEAIGQVLHIVNPDTLAICAEHEVGEIWIRGGSVTQGYWKNEEATDAQFQMLPAQQDKAEQQPFLRTGDLGYLSEGRLFITGRLKEMLIINGRNLYPQDIEETAQSVSEVLRNGCGAVFDVTHTRQDGNERTQVVLVQELTRKADRGEDALQRLTRQILQVVHEQHRVSLERVVFIPQGRLLKTSSGKIRRKAMQQQYLDNRMKMVAQISTSDLTSLNSQKISTARTNVTVSKIESTLLTLLSEALQRPVQQIDASTPFNEFGLESKALVGLAAELEDQLARPVPAHCLFDHPTVAQLASFLSGFSSDSKPTLSDPPHSQTHSQNEVIAIIGMGCRFPGEVSSPDQFWALLSEGKDAISLTPDSRWSNEEFYDADPLTADKMSTQWGGFIQGEREFDAEFFGIKPDEATVMDPQQRLLLETSWHALEQAGIDPLNLRGSETGVYVGLSNVDYSRHIDRNGVAANPWAGTGNAGSIAANRLSYFYDWCGPSVAVDTACSSSLVAIHQACQSLRQGESCLAVAAAVNLILAPDLSITFSKCGMMAADGHCKTFSDDADGYVRGEGCGVLILKPLSDAERDGDRILALIRGSALTQDGRSNGLTAPNGEAQQRCIEKALNQAGLYAADIDYVEAHGTGTALGDPIELNALAQAYGLNRSNPLHIGSVKSQIGHLEAAAGMAGVIKVVLALQHQSLPAQLHCQSLTRQFPWEKHPLEVVRTKQPWPAGKARLRRAGVSSFGFGGTNGHLILEEYPAADSRHNTAVVRQPTLFALSARTPEALREQARQYLGYLDQYAHRDIDSLMQAQWKQRAHLKERLAVRCESLQHLKQALRHFHWNQPDERLITRHSRASGHAHRITFMFTGQGSQFAGMGRELYLQEESFRNAIDQCHDLLLQISNIHLKRFILSQRAKQDEALLVNTDHTQPVMFCYEYALAQYWIQLGVQPHAVMGHSLGELVAATVAGIFRLQDGILLATKRGQLMQGLKERGGMMAVFSHLEDVVNHLDPSQAVSVGALNSPGQVVLSGSVRDLQTLALVFDQQGIETRMLNVSHGFHSPLMEPILGEFRNVLEGIEFSSATLPLISNVSGQVAGEEVTTVDYWCQHVLAPVNFLAGMNQVVALHSDLLLEVGPKATLSALAKRSLARDSIRIIASVSDPMQEYDSLQTAIAECYVSGVDIQWPALTEQHQASLPELPLYPFQRETYWVDKTSDTAGSGYEKPSVSLSQSDVSALPQAPLPAIHTNDDRLDTLLLSLRGQIALSLGIDADEIDTHKPIQDLGVDSITTLTLLTSLRKTFGNHISAAMLQQAASLEDLATQIQRSPESRSDPTAQFGHILNTGKPGALPLFLIHPTQRGEASDQAGEYHDLAEALGDEQPLIVMTPPDMESDKPNTDWQPIITTIANNIRRLQPHGPYMLCGWSMGATLAVEVGYTLTRQGEEVRFVAAIDAPCLFNHRLTPDILEQYCGTYANQQSAPHLADALFQFYSPCLDRQPSRYRFDIPFFQCETDAFDLLTLHSQEDWASYSQRPCLHQTIPGHHFSLFESGNVETLASYLRKLVRRYATLGNRFLHSSVQSGSLAQSLIQLVTDDTRTPFRAQLLVDETDSYFFDHELDHIPGILLIAGAWELICRSTQELDPLNAQFYRRVSEFSCVFERFAEKNLPMYYQMNCVAGDSHSLRLECHLYQNEELIAVLQCTLDYRNSKPHQLLPAQRGLIDIEQAWLHKEVSDNVLICRPQLHSGYWRTQPQRPATSHYLTQSTLAYGCLNPLFALESVRQMLTWLSHERFGVELGTHVNLIDMNFRFPENLDFSETIEMRTLEQDDKARADEFQTLELQWRQGQRTVMSCTLSAQTTHDETYRQQRSPYFESRHLKR